MCWKPNTQFESSPNWLRGLFKMHQLHPLKIISDLWLFKSYSRTNGLGIWLVVLTLFSTPNWGDDRHIGCRYGSTSAPLTTQFLLHPQFWWSNNVTRNPFFNGWKDLPKQPWFLGCVKPLFWLIFIFLLVKLRICCWLQYFFWRIRSMILLANSCKLYFLTTYAILVCYSDKYYINTM